MADDESVTSRRRERMAYRCSVTLGLADNVYVRFYILSGYDSDFQRSYFFFFFFSPLPVDITLHGNEDRCDGLSLPDPRIDSSL